MSLKSGICDNVSFVYHTLTASYNQKLSLVEVDLGSDAMYFGAFYIKYEIYCDRISAQLSVTFLNIKNQRYLHRLSRQKPAYAGRSLVLCIIDEI